MATARAAAKFALFFFWSALLIPPQILIMLFSRGRAAYILPELWHRMICRAFSLKVETIGHLLRESPALYVSNHVSYLDIPVISSVFPASFIAKAEVAGWPVFGLLAKLQQTVFISRSRAAVGREKNGIESFLAQGKSVIFFPEGTSSDGTAVLPFKSSLFGIALEAGKIAAIQPFTVELVEVDGLAVSESGNRDLYAWYGDMTLMPHFWNFAKSRGAKVRLHFHTPLRVKESDDRKNLARACHERVAGVLAEPMEIAA